MKSPLLLSNPEAVIGFDFATIFLALFLFAFVFLSVVIGIWIWTHFYRYRDREKRSLDSVLLQVAVSRGNEVKIDAMEQLFASLHAIKKGGWKQRFSTQPQISFEIIAKPEEIRFYVWTYKSLQDLVEKQIHGAYPDAEIVEVPEHNIFTQDGKVAYKSFQLKKDSFYPIKTFKELPTDPLASLTSALAKMGPGEGAAIQILVSPQDDDGKYDKKIIPKRRSIQSQPKPWKPLKIKYQNLGLISQFELLWFHRQKKVQVGT